MWEKVIADLPNMQFSDHEKELLTDVYFKYKIRNLMENASTKRPGRTDQKSVLRFENNKLSLLPDNAVLANFAFCKTAAEKIARLEKHADDIIFKSFSYAQMISKNREALHGWMAGAAKQFAAKHRAVLSFDSKPSRWILNEDDGNEHVSFEFESRLIYDFYVCLAEPFRMDDLATKKMLNILSDGYEKALKDKRVQEDSAKRKADEDRRSVLYPVDRRKNLRLDASLQNGYDLLRGLISADFPISDSRAVAKITADYIDLTKKIILAENAPDLVSEDAKELYLSPRHFFKQIARNAFQGSMRHVFESRSETSSKSKYHVFVNGVKANVYCSKQKALNKIGLFKSDGAKKNA